LPDPPVGSDVLLEIDLQGARQVRSRRPDATLILLLPPNLEIQAERLRSRGDSEEHVAKRLKEGTQEEAAGRQIADAVVVNDGMMQAVAEVAGIVGVRRSSALAGERPAGGTTGGANVASDVLPDDASEGS
jgi:guanylate kinase